MARTILILTSKTGGGHVSLAQALRDRLVAKHTIEILDPQSRFFHWHYRVVSRYALWLWSAEFQTTDTTQRALLAHRLFTRTVAAPLTATIKQLRPDLIITTYPFLTYEVIQVLKRMHRAIPFVMLFTDPDTVHASWLTEKGATATLAPTHETYEQALQAGFAPERLYQVGWPVREQFYHTNPTQRNEILTQLGLSPERFTIFLQGGGEGAAQFGRTVARVLGIHEQIQIILATGTNQTLLTRFQNVNRVAPLPFTKEIAPFMAAADVIMGKAGPNMLFEAVTLGKPFIATAYIPGQEENNLDFIRRHKLGWVTLAPAQQTTLLTRLVNDPSELQAMTDTVAAYHHWNMEHTELITPLIERLL